MKIRRFLTSACLSLVWAMAPLLGAEAESAVPRIDAFEHDPAPKEPLAIGGQKQLFLDRYIIADTDEVLLTMMPPQKFPGNPVLRPDSPSDGGILIPELVLWNPEKQRFQMWYDSVHGDKTGVNNLGTEDSQLHLSAYAESTDGIHWEKPTMNVREFQGSKSNNLLEGLPWDMIHDEHDPDPERRYKRVTWWRGPDVAVWFSPDGIHWKPSSRNPVLSPTGDTHSILGWDERHGKYVGYFRPLGEGGGSREYPRKIGISFSDDFENWTPIVPILAPDKHDPVGTEFYWMRVLKYEGIYLGFLTVLHLDRNLLDLSQPDPAGVDQTSDLQLVVSRDGIRWRRMGNRTPWLPRGTFQSWDDMNLWPSIPLLVGDEIRFYYSGVSLRHDIGEQATAGKKLDGRLRDGSIGLATLRRDGWVAARPNYGGKGSLTTRSLTFEGDQLVVNADAAEGSVRVEILDAQKQPIAGFSGTDAAVLRGNSIRHRVAWKQPLNSLRGKAIRLRFSLEKARLYAFQFEG